MAQSTVVTRTQKEALPSVASYVSEISGAVIALALIGCGLRLLWRRSLNGSGWFLALALLLPVNALIGIAVGMGLAFGRIVDDESASSAVLANGIALALEGHLWMLGVSLVTVPLAIWLFIRNRRRQKVNAGNHRVVT